MSINMQSIFRMIGLILTAIFLISFGSGLVDAVQVPSMIAHLGVQASTHPASHDIDIYDQLRSKSESLFKPFEKLMTKLARPDRTACDLEADFRLLDVSRAFQSDAADETHDGDFLEAVKSLYGIRKAICETGIDSTQLPSACHKLLPSSDPQVSRKSMTRSEIYLASSGIVSACLQKFQQQHYLWTSYSNNRQDANSMLHLLRSDVEMRNIIMTYRDFESSMNEFREEFDMMRTKASSWYDDAYKNAQNLFGMQDKTFERFEKGFGNVSSIVMHELTSINNMLDDSQNALRELSSTASMDLSNLNQDISTMTYNLVKMKDAMAQIYSDAAVEAAVLTRSHTNTAKAMYDAVEVKSQALKEGLDDVMTTIYGVQEFVAQIRDLHSRNLDQIEEQYELAGLVLDKQRASSDLLDHIYGIVERLSTETQDLGTAVNSITYLISLVQQHEQFLVAICIYIAMSVVLAVLNGIIIPHRVVTNLKSGYWALQAAIFLLKRLDPLNRLKYWEQTGLLVICLIAAISSTIVVLYLFCLAHLAVRTPDIEKAAPQGQRERTRSKHYVSQSQKQRLHWVPRKARHSTAPPGL